ncbi:MAG TPA: phosphoribosyltransferase family protein [Candidatus Paceibacterota bacterium]
MNLIRALYSVVLDALFPLHPAERAVLSCGPEGAWNTLPRAPHVREARMCGIFAYKDERVAQLIWSIKYKKSHAGSAIAGYAMHQVAHQFLAALPHDMPVVIVPMPITRRRRRERGFNQCELIMEAMIELDTAHRLAFAPGILERVHHTSRLTLKDRQHRLDATATTRLFATRTDSVERLMTATNTADPAQLFIIVIDDVITTGSTMKSALEVLHNTGFTNLCGLSVAH